MEIIQAFIGGVYIDRFQAGPDEAWCILGANRSGIDEFFSIVTGQQPPDKSQTLVLPPHTGVVSFEKQQQIYENELKKDDTDFMDRLDPGTLARDFLNNVSAHQEMINAWGLTESLDKGYRQLSHGQARKLMLLSHITKGCACLIIQSPFEGLDAKSRQELEKVLADLFSQGVQILVFVNNRQDIPECCTHLAVMAQGKIFKQGSKVFNFETHQGVMPEPCGLRLGRDDGKGDGDIIETDLGASIPKEIEAGFQNDTQTDAVIRLIQGSAGYGGRSVFNDFTLIIRKGEHTLVTGPNGCGKSTLLQMITGDHPACYTNDLHIFGMRRGSGESVWDLKKKMGIVSADLHRNYRAPASACHCVLSGLFDSIGIYRPYTPSQEAKALAWLDRLGLKEKAGFAFKSLSFAEQRLALIGRALIKLPELLILDEPTQGLDDPNRQALLAFLARLAEKKICTILYVSHREDEFAPFFKQHVHLEAQQEQRL